MNIAITFVRVIGLARLAFPLLLSAVSVLSIGGCDDSPPALADNQWWYSDSVTEPDSIERDGITWKPASCTGVHLWIYYPEAVLSAIQASGRLPPNTILTIDSAGGKWFLVRDENTCVVQAPWETKPSQVWTIGSQTDHDVYTGGFLLHDLCAAAISGVVLLCIVVAMRNHERKEREKIEAAAETGTKLVRTTLENLNKREKELQQRERAVEKQAKQVETWHQSETAKFEKVRRDTDEYYERGMEMVKSAQAALKSGPGSPTSEAVARYLREHHGQGAAFGDFIGVTFLADRTGFIRLKWQVQLKRNEPPIVVINRDRKLIRTDSGFNGDHGDHLVPGRRYVYHFSVRDEKDREFGKPLWLEVKIPLKENWDFVGNADSDEQELKIREKFKTRFNGIKVSYELITSAKEDVQAKHYPQEMEEWLLDKLDALGSELRGE
jgi:hypothetical protein